MKKLLLLFVLLELTFSVSGQSIFNKNLYTINPVQINPAYMGSQGKLFLGFQSSISGNNELSLPTYSSINVHGALFENLGIGVNVLSENQGPFSLTLVDAGSSYQVYLGDYQSIRFGNWESSD